MLVRRLVVKNLKIGHVRQIAKPQVVFYLSYPLKFQVMLCSDGVVPHLDALPGRVREGGAEELLEHGRGGLRLPMRPIRLQGFAGTGLKLRRLL